MAAAAQSAGRLQQPQQPQQPRVLYRRPSSLGMVKVVEEWADSDECATTVSQPLASTPHVRGASAPGPSTRQQYEHQKRTGPGQHVVWAQESTSPVARLPPRPRPASAGSPAAAAAAAASATAGGGGGIIRAFGGSPSLNAAAAALAERQTTVDALASLRSTSQGKCAPRGVGGGGAGGGGADWCGPASGGGSSSSSSGGLRRDVEGLSEEVRSLRGELLAIQEQNRVLRTEHQRLEKELSRYRTNLVKAEEVMNARERSLSPNTGMSRMFRSPATTALVSGLRDQLVAQQAQSESLRAQLEEVMRGTRATRVAELQAEVRAQGRELSRQLELTRLMRRRMEESEARAAEAIDRCNTAEKLARMQGPLAALQQAIAASEAKIAAGPAGGGGAIAGPGGGGSGGYVPEAAMAAAEPAEPATLPRAEQQPLGADSTAETAATEPPQPATAVEGGDGAAAGAAEPEAAARSRLAYASSQSSTPSSLTSSPSAFSSLLGGQTLSSGRVKKTMAALGDAHRALLSQATLLTELLPPGLTTEQLAVRAALRPATSGAPEVLRYLRHHVHKLVDVMSGLPGNRLEMIPDDDTSINCNGNGSYRCSNGNSRNGNRNGRATPRTSMSGQGLRASAPAPAGGARGRSGGGGGGSSTAGGCGTAGGGSDEFDPWSLLSELLDFVRWLRGLDRKSLATRPDLEGGLEQLSSVVAICDQETRRLLSGGGGGGKIGSSVA